MKHFIQSVVLMIISSMIVFATSCSDEKDEPVDNKAKFTVMLYGCGGATLDDAFFDNLKQAIAYGSTDDVKMTYLMKLSKVYAENHDVGNMEGTFRMMLPERRDTTGLDVFKLETTRIGDSTIPLYEPQTLAEFIKWSAQVAPAENYILVLWNHGGGWNISSDARKTRSILSDDNVDKHPMALWQCVQGIKDSGIRLKVLLTDACNMHTLENLFDYATVADYCVGAAQPTPDYGTNYYNLLKHLNSVTTGDESLEKQLRLFADGQQTYWFTHPLETDYDKDEYYGDMGVVDLRKLPAVASAVSDIAGELCSSYATHHDAYDLAAEQCHLLFPARGAELGKYRCGFDAYDYFNQLAVTSGNDKLRVLADRFAQALAQAQYRVTCNPSFRNWKGNVSVGIIVTNEALYNELNYEKTYPLLEFDKQSGWSRWLKTNQHHPSGKITYTD
ncbi:clostripain-related cysteine peptidase [Sodaliphilus sp.]|uniref:clostripain-related cysteine peptidase n=1 Tax=Sodaliphilus sp. TaxID=2815818 RepID=UPI00388DF8A5